MTKLLRDLRYAARSLLRAPLFTLGVALILALGIGVNAAMFGIVDTLFLKPPGGVRDPAGVARVYLRRNVRLMRRTFTSPMATYLTFTDLRDGHVFDQTAAMTVRPVSLGRGTEAYEAQAGVVSHGFFPLLGVRPAIGRFFGADEDRPGGEQVAVLSYRFWKGRFGGEASVIGRSLKIGTGTYTVIGVGPEGFGGIDLTAVDLWLPVQVAGPDIAGTDALTSRGRWWLQVVARLKPGERLEDAAARATLVYRRGATIKYADDSTAQVLLGPIQEVRGPRMQSDAKVSLWIGVIAVVVLLLACANVANLLLARGVSRRRELAVRAGLGAGRVGLVRLMLAESLVLAALGGGAALVLAVWAGAAVRGVLVPDLPADLPLIDVRVLAFTGAAVLLTAALTGIVPAVQSSRTDLVESLKSGGHGATSRGGRTRSLLLATQIALTLVLLVGAGLFVRSLRNVQAQDFGFDAPNVLMARMNLDATGASTAAIDQTYLRILERVRFVPGVEHAAGVTEPFGWMFSTDTRVEGWDSIPRLAGGGPFLSIVTADYFATLGTRLVAGRDFTPSDRQGSDLVTILNQSMAKTLWPGGALGKCVYVGAGNADPCRRVIGVVGDAHQGNVVEEPGMQYFLPYGQYESAPAKASFGGYQGPHLNGLYIRVRGDPAAAIEPVRRVIQAVGDFPHASIATLADQMAPQLRSWKLGAAAFSAFGVLALVIAAMGIFAVISYSVSQRTHEIGIRMALGAEATQVARLILGQGLRATVVGIGAGAAGAYALGRGIKALLYEVTPGDPLVFLSVVALLLAVAGAATYWPARRAARVDPMVALRHE
jgi:predicted permease